MAFGRTKLLFSFALLGFLVGSVTYLVFNWIITNSAIGIIYIYPTPISEIISAPWFMSGAAGSLLSVIIIYVSARFSGEQ